MCLSRNCKGVVLIMAMIFLVIFAALAVSLSSMCGTNLQIAHNQHKANSALCAAESALECGRYIVAQTLPELDSTPRNFVSDDETEQAWLTLCAQVQLQPWVNGQAQQTADEIITPITAYSENSGSFRIRFYRENTHKIRLEGIGTDKDVVRNVSIEMDIAKDNEVMNYAIAGRGRMWITDASTINGNIFSAWRKANISPFNMTSDSAVNGTVNTRLTLEEIENEGAFQMETLGANGYPIDINGDPLETNYENRYYGPDDEVQAYHENINYGQQCEDMPGLDEDDYDTSSYEAMCTNIPTSETQETEYFPHAEGNYNAPGSSAKTLHRHVYDGQTFTNARLPRGRNALFRNCTFEEVLFVDSRSYTGSTDNCNNVRFENCQFNGVVVTDVPKNNYIQWRQNCLYFTGASNTFDNQSSIPEATILAPNFNINVGNTTDLEPGEGNILTGAIVGGIVDVRGNAEIHGTIISMYDTYTHSSGYVTNIGTTDDDGGSEGGGYSGGTIIITPDPTQMLPSGVTSPIIIRPLQETYSEGF